MAHLGSDVAAFVDGQLSEPAMREASDHLESCDDCAKAVRQQRLLKSRMSTVAAPEPPATLIASLAGLAAAPPARERWWVRVGRAVPFKAGVVLVGASMAVVVAAYAVGGQEQRPGDEVAPPFNRYAAEFSGTTAVPAADVITQTTMAELDGSGWPCHATLAGNLRRTSASYTDGDEVVALSYSDGESKLNLFEQVGRLDEAALDGFTSTRLAGAQVWVREGQPRLVTWDEDGVVYTIVTDADADRVERAVADLPRTTKERGVPERVGDGINRMTSWLDAA